MTPKQLSTLTWQFTSVFHYGNETIQELVEPTYGFINRLHKKIDPDTGCDTLWDEYIYKGKSYKTWDEFAEAVKDVKYIPKKKTDDGWFD
jgi:hypothetical protein